jgi:hypothetical protein
MAISKVLGKSILHGITIDFPGLLDIPSAKTIPFLKTKGIPQLPVT